MMLKQLRLERGWTHQQAADAMNVSRGQYVKLERGERKLTADYIRQAARAFGVDEADILADGARRAKIVGYVGAGSEAHFYSTADDPQEDAPMPPNGNENTVAVVVRGGSLGHVFDGWLVYYDTIYNPPTPQLHHRLCVVEIPDGRVLVKKLTPSMKPGRFHLEAPVGESLHDQPVLWAALVKAMAPK